MNNDPNVAAACARLEASRRQLQAARHRAALPSGWRLLAGRHPWLLTSAGLLLGGLVMACKPWRALPRLSNALPTLVAVLTAASAVVPWASWMAQLLDGFRGVVRGDAGKPAAAAPPPP